jgi:hypothetical protein
MIMRSWKMHVAVSLSVAFAAAIAIVSVGPARAAVESFFACASSAPCLEWDNSQNGDAIKGVSTNGTALEGRTKFKSAGKTAGKSGVLGADVSTSGTLNSGVSGTSINGTGVIGTSTGLSGLNGVSGFSSSTFASGVYGQDSSTGFGVSGRNTSTTHNNQAAGILADGGSSNDALHATSASANAIYAFSQNGTPLFANQGANSTAPELYLQDTSSSSNYIIEAVGPSGDLFDVKSSGDVNIHGDLLLKYLSVYTPSATGENTIGNVPGNLSDALVVVGGGVNTGDEVFAVRDSNLRGVMRVTDRGDVSLSGLLYTQGQCSQGCIVGNKRVRAVTEYSPLESDPTIEDNGEATLAGGFAYVTLDPKFANVIDKSSAYLVSVTPEGDCNGLYVAQRTPGGFTVRELRDGHGTVSFEYRIVAKRYGVHAPRLPMTDVIQPPTRRSPHG